MRIHVGSRNPVKLNAVKIALWYYPQFRSAEIKWITVDSGVSPQPKNILETMLGAETRARAAFRNCDYSIGLESGTMVLPLPNGTRYVEQTICAFYDGTRMGIGFSPAFEIPPLMARMLMEDHVDLEQASCRAGLTHKQKLGQEEGIIGILTHGVVDRTAYTIPAIHMALTTFQNPELYARRT